MQTYDDVSWTVRATGAADKQAVLAVVGEAFSGPGRDGKAEVDIVSKTWALAAGPKDLDLVAVDDNVIVAHALASVGDLQDREALALAPLCVKPSRQGGGIGSALVTELLSRAEVAGWPLVLVLGDTRYYGQFGFEPAGRLGIHYRPVGRDDPHFQVRRLARFDPSLRGEFTYCWEGERRSSAT